MIISTQYMPIRTQLLRKCEHFYGNRPLARSALERLKMIYAVLATILNLVPYIWDTVSCIRDTVPNKFSMTSYL